MLQNLRQPVALSGIKVSGALDQRIHMGLQHLLRERGRLLGEGHTQSWGADGVGRWIYAVSQASAYTGKAIPELDETVEKLIAVQDATGIWGQIPVHRWEHWGNSRAMVGLAEYWDLTKDAAALAALRKAGDLYLRLCDAAMSHDHGNPSFYPGSAIDGVILRNDNTNPPFYPAGVIEGLMAVWRVTGVKCYLEAAEQAAAYAIRQHVFFTREPVHMHADILTPLRGFVELFLATGKREYLAVAQEMHTDVLAKDMWVTGGIPETRNYTPFETRDETCQVADWFRLSLLLWQATGDAIYMDVAEHTLLNHLFFNQDQSGGFCAARSFSTGPTTRLSGRDFVAWICCSMHGLRALEEAVRFVYTHDDDSIDVNLYMPSAVRIALRDGAVSLKQVTDYPSVFATRVEVATERTCAFRLRLRIPRWARSWQMTVNGQPCKPEMEGGYAAIRRTWQAGDRAEISFEAGIQVVPDGINGFAVNPAAVAGSETGVVHRGALTYGPLVLMVDPALHPHQMYDWDQIEILAARGQDGGAVLSPVDVLVPGRGEFSVPGMCFMTLGRNVKIIEKREKSIFDPDVVDIQQEQTPSTGFDPGDESWKLVFLVPVSEITDRWTPTAHRIVPYEVRNDIRLLEEMQADALVAETRRQLEAVRTAKWLKTTGYLMRLTHMKKAGQQR